MSALSLTQALRRCLFFSTVGFVLFINEGEQVANAQMHCISINFNILHVPATACQVHPSEYAYEVNSVTEQESISANCRRYTNVDGLPQGVDSTDYIHCDGAQLKLADNNLGSEQSFSSISHYQWPARSTAQLLFIFPTRVSLTSITLHYYCDSLTGLPRLIFYAVRNDFDVWDSPTLNTPHVDVDVASVPLGEEPAGRKSASINVNFSTKKVLMYKFRSVFKLAMSEVEFFTCRK